MPSYSSGEIIDIIRRDLRGLSGEFTDQQYIDAAGQASRDCGWGYPVSTDFKISWSLKRTKRALLDSMRAEAADDFRVNDYHLQHRFRNYNTLIVDMDKEFVAAVEENPAEFANVDTSLMFGIAISAGFSYDYLGRDTSYNSSQEVIHDPEND